MTTPTHTSNTGGALKRFRGAGAGAGGLSHEAMQAIQREEEAKRADTGALRGWVFDSGRDRVYTRVQPAYIMLITKTPRTHAGTFFWGGGQGSGNRGGGGGGGRPPREVDPSNTTIFVGGLPPGFALEQLKQGFSHYGAFVIVAVDGWMNCLWFVCLKAGRNEFDPIYMFHAPPTTTHNTPNNIYYYRRDNPRAHAPEQRLRLRHLRRARAGPRRHRQPGCAAWLRLVFCEAHQYVCLNRLPNLTTAPSFLPITTQA